MSCSRHFHCQSAGRSALSPAYLSVVLAAALTAAACGQAPAAPPARREGGAPVAVRTATVQHMSVQRQVDLAGTLLSPDQAKVSAEASGVVREVLVEIGREVRAGDPLVKLETRELALALARAESALRQTRAQLGMHGDIGAGDTPPPDDEVGSVRNALASLSDVRANAERAKMLSSRG